MFVKSVTESSFGNYVEGVEIRLTREESYGVVTMLRQGVLFPPERNGNIDHAAKTLGEKLIININTLLQR